MNIHKLQYAHPLLQRLSSSETQMPAHQGFQVHIASEGRALKEYEVVLNPLEGGTSVLTCYIPSECGKEFEVFWREPAMGTDMIVKVSMDGQLTDEVAHFEYDGTGESKGVIEFGQKAVRPYRFENIKTTDDERLAHSGRVSAKLGTITVALFRIALWDECKARPRFDSKSVVNPRYVHEADKMEGQHTVGFGARRVMTSYSCSYQVYKPVGEEHKPFLIFNFKYRPRAVLESLGIVPPLAHKMIARKRPLSPSLITNTSKRSRDDSEALTEVHDSEGESEGESSQSSGSEGSGTSPEPESEEGVIREASVVGQTGEDDAECQERYLAACHACQAAELAVIKAQVEKLEEELAKKKKAIRALLRH
ncbi:hypothetical protein LXA43DRAFT_938385 [Ganoderma leucocontextum]|nr:hypothetical protein LXA43DRAFT_938385 [Ganoderma leucocontextum]